MNHAMDANFELDIERMSELSFKLEKLFSLGSETELGVEAVAPAKRRTMSEAFSELELLFQPWIVVRAN